MTALEDSTLKFEALKPAYKAAILQIKAQKNLYETEKTERMFEKLQSRMQIDISKTALVTEIKAGGRKKMQGIKTGGKIGVPLGVLLGLIIAAATH